MSDNDPTISIPGIVRQPAIDLDQFDDGQAQSTLGPPGPDTLRRIPGIVPITDLESAYTTARRLSTVHTPDQIAQAVHKSKASGLPPSVYLNSPPELHSHLDDTPAPDFDAFTRDHPETAAYLSNPTTMAMAYDDWANLGRIESVFKTVATRWDRGKWQTQLGRLRWAQIMGDDSAETQALVRESKERLNQYLPPTKGWIMGGLAGASEMLPLMLEGTLQGTSRGLALATGFGLIGGAALGGPAILPAVAAGGSVGFTWGTTQNILEAEAGLAYDELVNLPGMDPAIAKPVSVAVGVVNAALEYLQIMRLLDVIPGVDTLVREAVGKAAIKAAGTQTLRSLAANRAREYGEFLVMETTQEVLQEAVAITGQETAKAINNALKDTDIDHKSVSQVLDQLTEVAVQSLQAFSIMGGLGVSGKFAVDAASNRKGVQDIAEALSLSKLAARSPETAEAYLGHLAESSPDHPSQLYIPARDLQTLYQGDPGGLRAFLDQTGVAEEDFVEAVALDTDVEFATKKLAYLWNNSRWEEIGPSLSTVPSHQLDPDYGKPPDPKEQAEVEALASLPAPATRPVAELTRIRNMFVSAGRSEQEANALTSLLEARAAVVESATGQPAGEWLSKTIAAVVREPTPAPGAPVPPPAIDVSPDSSYHPNQLPQSVSPTTEVIGATEVADSGRQQVDVAPDTGDQGPAAQEGDTGLGEVSPLPPTTTTTLYQPVRVHYTSDTDTPGVRVARGTVVSGYGTGKPADVTYTARDFSNFGAQTQDDAHANATRNLYLQPPLNLRNQQLRLTIGEENKLKGQPMVQLSTGCGRNAAILAAIDAGILPKSYKRFMTSCHGACYKNMDQGAQSGGNVFSSFLDSARRAGVDSDTAAAFLAFYNTHLGTDLVPSDIPKVSESRPYTPAMAAARKLFNNLPLERKKAIWAALKKQHPDQYSRWIPQETQTVLVVDPDRVRKRIATWRLRGSKKSPGFLDLVNAPGEFIRGNQQGDWLNELMVTDADGITTWEAYAEAMLSRWEKETGRPREEFPKKFSVITAGWYVDAPAQVLQRIAAKYGDHLVVQVTGPIDFPGKEADLRLLGFKKLHDAGLHPVMRLITDEFGVGGRYLNSQAIVRKTVEFIVDNSLSPEQILETPLHLDEPTLAVATLTDSDQDRIAQLVAKGTDLVEARQEVLGKKVEAIVVKLRALFNLDMSFEEAEALAYRVMERNAIYHRKDLSLAEEQQKVGHNEVGLTYATLRAAKVPKAHMDTLRALGYSYKFTRNGEKQEGVFPNRCCTTGACQTCGSQCSARYVGAIRAQRMEHARGIIANLGPSDAANLLAEGRLTLQGEMALDAPDPSTLFQGETWHSQMLRVLEEKLVWKGKGRDRVKALMEWAKRGQFKQEELEWSGVLDWLKDQEGRNVTKQGVLDWVKENGYHVQVREVVKDAPEGVVVDDTNQPDSAPDWFHDDLLEQHNNAETNDDSPFYDVFDELARDTVNDDPDFYIVDQLHTEGVDTDALLVNYLIEEEGYEHDAAVKRMKEAKEYDEYNYLVAAALDSRELDRIRANAIHDLIMGMSISDIEDLDGAVEDLWLSAVGDAAWDAYLEVHGDPDVDPDSIPKYSQYQEGGPSDSYTELAITIPAQTTPEDRAYLDYRTSLYEKYNLPESGVGLHDNATTMELVKLSRMAMAAADNPTPYFFERAHWAEPNVVVFVRFNTRVDAQGRTIMFLEEVQSDWHQKGKAEGYSGQTLTPEQKAQLSEYEAKRADVDAMFNVIRAKEWEMVAPSTAPGTRDDLLMEIGTLKDHARQAELELQDLAKGLPLHPVPNAPFKTTWPLLAMKRALRWAAEHNMDMVAWTPATIQVDRWTRALRRRVDKITWTTNDNGILATAFKNGEQVYRQTFDPGTGRGVVREQDGTYRTVDELFGPTMAGQMKSEPVGTIEGDDLILGGAIYRHVYDKALPTQTGRFVKQWGSKVTTTHLDLGKDASVEVWAVEVNQAMKESAQAEGLPLFQDPSQGGQGGQVSSAGPGPRGATTFLPSGAAVIRLFDAANTSTALHELGHIFLADLARIAQSPDATPQVRADYMALSKWVGAAPGQPWTVAQHEKFAAAWERYFLAGKSPTPALSRVFELFRKALLRVYKAIRNRLTSTQLDTDIAAVMDRMLATEEDLKAAREFTAMTPLFRGTGKAKDILTDAAWAAYRQTFKDAAEAMGKVARQRLVFDLARLTEQWTKEGRAAAKDHPDQVLIRSVIESDGISREAAEEQFDAGVIQQINSKRPGLIRKGGALPADPSLIQALLRAKTQKELIAQYVQAHTLAYRQTTQLSDMFTVEYERLLEAEERILAKAAGVSHTPVLSTARTATAINKSTSATTVSRLSATHATTLAAMQQAALAADKAFRAGDLARARVEKSRQRALLASYRAKTRAREETRKAIARAKRFCTSKSLDPDYREHIRAVATAFSMVGPSLAPVNPGDLSPLSVFLDETDPDHLTGAKHTVAPWIFSPGAAQSYKKLTFEQLMDVDAAIQLLAHAGRTKHRLLSTAKKETIADAVSNMIAAIERSGLTPEAAPDYVQPPGHTGWSERQAENLRKYWASILKPEFLIRALDGGQTHGIVWQYLFRPIVEAEQAEITTWEDVGGRLATIFAPYRDRARKWGKMSIAVQGLPQTWSKEQIIMVALNSGHEDNLDAIREGYDLTDAQIQTLLDTLTRDEWALVHKVWALVDSQYAPLATAYKAVHGAPLKKVTGGRYFPLVFDHRLDYKAASYYRDNQEQNYFESAYRKAAATAGSTHARKGGKAPVLLSFSVIHRHLREVIHYHTHAVAVRDVGKLINNRDLRLAITTHMGKAKYDQFKPWLQRVAIPGVGPINEIERAVEHLRRNTTTVMLGLKASVALKQPISLTQTIATLGFAPTMAGVWDFYSNIPAATAMVRAKSAFIRARQKSWDRELANLAREFDPTALKVKLGGRYVGRNEFNDAFFTFIGIMDTAATYPTWIAAYKVAQARGDTEASAIEYADTIVRTTQPAASPKDLAAIQRGGPFLKLGTMFYTFFSVFINSFAELNGGWVRGNISTGQLLKGYAWMVLIPSLVSMLINEQGLPGEDDDLEGFVRSYIRSLLGYVSAGLPFVRDVLALVLDRLILGKSWGYQLSPALEGLESLERFTNAAAKTGAKVVHGRSLHDEDYWNLYKSAVETAGYGLGLPSKQIIITTEGTLDLANGRTSNPMRLLLPEK